VAEFDEQIRFTEFNGGVTVRTLFRGDEYAAQNVVICFYQDDTSPREAPSGVPRCNPPPISASLTSNQAQPYVYPRRSVGSSPVEVLSAEALPCVGEDVHTETPPTPCPGGSAPVPGGIGVINFFQRDVSHVAVVIYFDGSGTNNYTISGYTEIGASSPVTSFSTGNLRPSASYQLTLSSPEQPIRQVVIQGTNDAAPLYIVSIALRYAR
jgi:hypothetical protein